MTVTRVDEWTWAVPSRSEQDAFGNPVVRLVTVEDVGGRPILCCDCPAGGLAFRRVVCHHARQVAALFNTPPTSPRSPDAGR